MVNLNPGTTTVDLFSRTTPAGLWTPDVNTNRALRRIVQHLCGKAVGVNRPSGICRIRRAVDTRLTRIFLQVCLGGVLAHATELIHQCLHRSATGRASRDQFFGMLIATPLGISFWRYLTDHFRHHKDVTQESFSYNYDRMDSTSLPVRLYGFLRHVSMVDRFSRPSVGLGPLHRARRAETGAAKLRRRTRRS